MEKKYQSVIHILLITATLVGYSQSQVNTSTNFCPTLTCSEDLGTRVCYQHSRDTPVSSIKVDPCPGADQVCDIYPSKNMAWVDQISQYNTLKGVLLPQYSQVSYRNTIGYCKNLSSQQKGLNAGRRCLYNHQCNSMNCDNGVCRGKPQGSDCATHQECDVDNACRREWSWPFNTRCKSYAQSRDMCDSDYDCLPGYMCAYESSLAASQGVQRCLLKYS